ncbi:sulfite exporter TauE/SafE family protein [Halomonas sp. ML-15]|uniref:sulfite exporter TauE/SafE family protein n=1 Tax=Halomonas sp. ML-15 TaxID=2773305 RepID=UPI001746C656|nr:sulfite exporter TauE/SafE family protein [Halomonas sp. ML-15]MBD3895957.1 sulfite exporter TauE/SafE family protein [Halomonas sp. ML-15]
MVDFASLLVVTSTFLLAGSVKGVIGLGLPTVSLALLTVAMDLPTAMALLLIPSFVTNLWQSMVGGNARAILVRLWPFLAMATITVWLGAAALTRVNLSLLTALLGSLLIIYAVVNLAGIKIFVPSRHEYWAGPLIGSANGVLTGMTGSFVVPGVMFLQAIGLPRNMLIQAMGMLFTVSTVALAAALQQANFLTVQYGAMSAAAVLPALAGMVLGQRIRERLSEKMFRSVFFISLLLLGAYIMVNALQKL